jgi:hypothetical protein
VSSGRTDLPACPPYEQPVERARTLFELTGPAGTPQTAARRSVHIQGMRASYASPTEWQSCATASLSVHATHRSPQCTWQRHFVAAIAEPLLRRDIRDLRYCGVVYVCTAGNADNPPISCSATKRRVRSMAYGLQSHSTKIAVPNAKEAAGVSGSHFWEEGACVHSSQKH